MNLEPYQYHECPIKKLNQNPSNGMAIKGERDSVQLLVLSESDISYGHYLAYSFSINYCPWCGEKLDE